MNRNFQYLEHLVTQSLQTLLEDFSKSLQEQEGRTSLLPPILSTSSSPHPLFFIDDILEEKLIMNPKTNQIIVVYRVFIQSIEDLLPSSSSSSSKSSKSNQTPLSNSQAESIWKKYQSNPRYFTGVGWLINESMPVCSMCRMEFPATGNGSGNGNGNGKGTKAALTAILAEKRHCYACGNIFCYQCCSHQKLVEGIEELGPVWACNLCDYGQVSASDRFFHH